MKGLLFSLLAAILGMVIVCLTIPPLIRVVNAKQLFEPIGKRKVHKTIIPSIGGVAIFIGFILSSFLASDSFSLTQIKYLFPAVILMFFIGLKDDLMILPARKKLIVQVCTAIMMVTIGNFRLTGLSGFLGIYFLDYFSGAFLSAFLIVACVNAFNFIDGIDGLAAGVGILISAILGTCFIIIQDFPLSIVCFALTGSLISFFYYNVFGKKYKLFMGDTGSLILGIILAGLILKFIELVPSSNIGLLAKYAPAFATGLMIIPLIDLTRVIFIRLYMKKSPFRPDNNHLHHKLLKVIPNHFTITMIFCGVNLLFVALTLILIYEELNITNIIWIIVSLGYFTAYFPFKVKQLVKEIIYKRRYTSFPD